MRFVADQALSHWRGSERIAQLCEVAGLSCEQAEVTRLVADGLSMSAMAGVLDHLEGEAVPYRQRYRQMRRAIDRAARLIRRSDPDLAALQRREAWQLLGCLRNIRRSNGPLLVYSERWFGYEREPLRLHSRLVGEMAEDLTGSPLRFLRDLPHLLGLRAARDSGD